MEDKIFTKRFWLTFGSQFFIAMVMYTLMSTMTEYASSLGTTASIAGLVSGIYVFGGLCSRLYSGKAMEKAGWKRIAVIFLNFNINRPPFIIWQLYFTIGHFCAIAFFDPKCGLFDKNAHDDYNLPPFLYDKQSGEKYHWFLS